MKVLRLRESSNPIVSQDEVVKAILMYGSEPAKRDILEKIENNTRT